MTSSASPRQNSDPGHGPATSSGLQRRGAAPRKTDSFLTISAATSPTRPRLMSTRSTKLSTLRRDRSGIAGDKSCTNSFIGKYVSRALARDCVKTDSLGVCVCLSEASSVRDELSACVGKLCASTPIDASPESPTSRKHRRNSESEKIEIRNLRRAPSSSLEALEDGANILASRIRDQTWKRSFPDAPEKSFRSSLLLSPDGSSKRSSCTIRPGASIDSAVCTFSFSIRENVFSEIGRKSRAEKS